MKPFDKAIKFVLRWEAGYSDDPDDPGGETNLGIAKKYHPDEDIKNLTLKRAKEIYRESYWNKCGASHAGHYGLAVVLFDTAVNTGVSRSVAWLQQAINQHVTHDPLRLHEDGSFGPLTLRMMQQVTREPGTSEKMVRVILARRLRHYASIRGDKYLKGWVNRVADLMLNMEL